MTKQQADAALVKQAYNFNTKLRGSHENEYAIYVENATALGWNVKTYDQWLNS